MFILEDKINRFKQRQNNFKHTSKYKRLTNFDQTESGAVEGKESS